MPYPDQGGQVPPQPTTYGEVLTQFDLAAGQAATAEGLTQAQRLDSVVAAYETAATGTMEVYGNGGESLPIGFKAAYELNEAARSLTTAVASAVLRLLPTSLMGAYGQAVKDSTVTSSWFRPEQSLRRAGVPAEYVPAVWAALDYQTYRTATEAGHPGAMARTARRASPGAVALLTTAAVDRNLLRGDRHTSLRRLRRHGSAQLLGSIGLASSRR